MSVTSKELVAIMNKQAVTTSLKVAEVFEKPHNDVLKAIRVLVSDLEGVGENSHTPKTATKYFRESTYIHSQNGQRYPMFYMNFNGFMLLTMGFTGKKALQFKLAYMEAFDEMRRIIAQWENEEWLAGRGLTKINLRELTDTIRDVLIPKMQAEGASEAAIKWVYKNYVNMVQVLLGIEAGTRDELPLDLLYELSKVEQMAMITIKELVASGEKTQQIYNATKNKLKNYAQLSYFEQRFLGR